MQNEKAPESDGIEELVIVGGGVAGFTAAMYAGRASIRPLLLTGESLGGQAAMTEMMENYPGFPDGVGGAELTELIQQGAVKYGARIEFDLVKEADLSQRPFILKTEGEITIRAHAIIIATGAQPMRLGIPGEREFLGRGLSFCATCDGFFYKEKTVAVIGGGNSALDEALYLARLASKVYIIHRRDQFRAEKIVQERVLRHERIEVLWNTVAEEIQGEGHVTGLRLRNVVSGETTVLPVDGVFEYVGMTPNTELFQGQLEIDDAGYLVTDRHQRTNVEGVFAAGDVQSPYFRQVVIAAGAGAAAAIEAERYLASLEM